MNTLPSPWLGYGYCGASFEYKSSLGIACLPLLPICGGVAIVPAAFHATWRWS